MFKVKSQKTLFGGAGCGESRAAGFADRLELHDLCTRAVGTEEIVLPLAVTADLWPTGSLWNAVPKMDDFGCMFHVADAEREMIHRA